jgi:DnaJ-class molecular chaperone
MAETIVCPTCCGRCEVDVPEDEDGKDTMPCPTCRGTGEVERFEDPAVSEGVGPIMKQRLQEMHEAEAGFNKDDWSPVEMAVCMGTDAMRLCLGKKPRNFHREEIIKWMTEMGNATAKLEPAFITSKSGGGEYEVSIKCETLQDLDAWHSAVLAIAKGSPKSVLSRAARQEG